MPILRRQAWILADPDLETILGLLQRRTGSAIPNLGELKQVIECSLTATLRPEEGRFPPFRLILEPPADCGDAVLIGDRPLSPETIRELAPVATQSMHLGVWRVPSGQLAIWGVTSKPPRARLAVVGFQPGSIMIRVGLETVAVYRQLERDLTLAEARGDDPGVGVGRAHAAHLLGRTILTLDCGLSVALGASLVLVADAIRRQGNGGVILVLPSNDPAPDLNLRFPARPGSRADRLMEAIDSLAPDIPHEWSEFWRAYREPSTPVSRWLRPILEDRAWEVGPELMYASSAFGDLTAVDGAVVLRRDLSLLGFGAVIETQATAGDSIDQLSVLDSMAGEVPRPARIADLGGTRRRSAARFVLRNAGSAAVIVSHDGPISIASWTLPEAPQDKPLLMRDIELLW